MQVKVEEADLVDDQLIKIYTVSLILISQLPRL
jgi:hypothetical protein